VQSSKDLNTTLQLVFH